jgi:hypothetical protein
MKWIIIVAISIAVAGCDIFKCPYDINKPTPPNDTSPAFLLPYQAGDVLIQNVYPIFEREISFSEGYSLVKQMAQWAKLNIQINKINQQLGGKLQEEQVTKLKSERERLLSEKAELESKLGQMMVKTTEDVEGAIGCKGTYSDGSVMRVFKLSSPQEATRKLKGMLENYSNHISIAKVGHSWGKASGAKVGHSWEKASGEKKAFIWTNQEWLFAIESQTKQSLENILSATTVAGLRQD